MSSVFKNIFVLAGMLLICGLGYYLYIQKNDASLTHGEGTPLTKDIQATQEAEILLRQLNEIKNIEINKELFSDPRFTTLINNTTQVQPSGIGRGAPFQPGVTN